MYEWMKKIHMYAGLLSFMAFVVWGITGVHAVFLPPPDGYEPPEVSAVEETPFEAPGALDDKQLAQLIFDTADLAMAGGYYNVRRNENGYLAFMSYTANGRRDLTYLEDKKVVRIEFRNSGLADFFSSMHAGHSRRGAPDLSSRLWGYYNELSTWAFFFMALSGVYMWVATRPGLPWAQICFGGAAVAGVILWFVAR
jgi:hypothetical protein